MHIISRKKITGFCEKHPKSSEVLNRWYRIVKTEVFRSPADVKNIFPSADQVGNLWVFNVGGNKYRLIAFIRYQMKRLFIRDILTHKEYDKEKWKEDEWYRDMKK
ncbi:type II toxin-antitoxin system HigB family toxin [Desulfonema ishimotonii]|uniref:Type II toxin-antitoxin system HigB family toxin n=1 Tax=Desulfonema ishimotonii TaxID=45657 RepID=A0A401G347_9BACT|nr:type II toxin-antitoxin system HigB family toxin [Desulfonema ishimotonii]GBC63613.1 type II toxin-antitoxin system HigB family toxin [Desulfonema ishimotonii]